jgi:hypothetical protein
MSFNSGTGIDGKRLVTSKETKRLLVGTVTCLILWTKSREFLMAKEDLNPRTLGNFLSKKLHNLTLGALTEEATGLIGTPFL